MHLLDKKIKFLIALQAFGLVNHSIHSADLSKNLLQLSLMEMYGEMGDIIALQYGGSVGGEISTNEETVNF